MVANSNIFSFDVAEETLRHELWVGTTSGSTSGQFKVNIDKFLTGDIYRDLTVRLTQNITRTEATAGIRETDYRNYPQGSGFESFIDQYKDSKFIETIEEYNPEGIASEESNSIQGTSRSLTKDKKKRMIIFTLMNE